MMGMEAKRFEKPAPDDGFFFAGGTATPGLTALLLSALDIEDGKTATVWLINPEMPMAKSTDMPTGFFRADICRLDKSSDEIRETWEESRETYKNWRPGGDTKTYALYPLPYDPGKSGGLYFAYVDHDGRLIRIEELGSPEPISVVLKKTQKKNKSWWGKPDKESQ